MFYRATGAEVRHCIREEAARFEAVRSPIDLLIADFPNGAVDPMQEAAAAQVEALLFESAPKKRVARKTRRATTHKTKREQKMKASSK